MKHLIYLFGWAILLVLLFIALVFAFELISLAIGLFIIIILLT